MLKVLALQRVPGGQGFFVLLGERSQEGTYWCAILFMAGPALSIAGAWSNR